LALHPPSLALAAYLHGGPRVGVVRSRVLLLGAGRGEDLLPLAFYDPEGSYLGVDDDAANIEFARGAAGEMGLSNVRFEAADWSEPPLTLGQFDVVIARGVLGRAAESRRNELLRLCRTSLADEGILYLDYPLIPGAASLRLVWSLIGPLVDPAGPVQKRVAQARAAAEAYRGMIASSGHPYPQLLAMDLSRVVESPDAVVWRDYIGAPGAVFLHRDVVRMAHEHGLRFVCDAAFNRAEGHVPAEIREELVGRGLSGLEMEQALDILRNRGHRGSVFCRAEVVEREPPGPDLLDELGMACGLGPKGEAVRLDPGVEEVFEGAGGERIASADPLLKAVLLELREGWPRPQRFGEVVSAAVMRLQREGAEGEPSDEHVAGLARDLWALFTRGMLVLLPNAPRFAENPGTALHGLGRFEARAGGGLTTPLHTTMTLSGFDAALVRHMEPGADEDGLVRAMLVHAAKGSVAIEVGGARLTDPMLLEPMVRGLVRRSVATFARWGLIAESDAVTPRA